ncbi:MAG: HAD-IIIA family hydrolase [Gammaproteobacteria bacterium]|nr:HAD-IIIA family hydrolase [Gammaproteobacteria bacterium]
MAPTPTERARGVRCVVLDVDGVMTDGRLYLGPDGVEWKAVHVRDGFGIKLLLGAGFEVAVISGRPAEGIAERLAFLGIRRCWFNVDDKVEAFETLRDQLRLEDREFAVMGDDVPDLPLLRRAGLAMTVADAHPSVIAAAHWTSRFGGGQGAVREAADLLLAVRERP